MEFAICLIGAGRIGAVHAENICATPGLELAYVVDVHDANARAIAAAYGGAVVDIERALEDPAVDGVVIASATDTHAELAMRAAERGKAIFCEKPIDLDAERARACYERVAQTGAPFIVGFNRRFDPSFAALKARLRADEIGAAELIQITSRDPAPPPLKYVASSGGLFRDMMIHDFDMAAWLLGEGVAEITATASVLVDEEIGVAGDVDTAAVTLKSVSGKIAVITNSRRAKYGYDQRIEVHGARGMLTAGNVMKDTVTRHSDAGCEGAAPHDSFLSRYAEAYRLEMAHLAAVLAGVEIPRVSGRDGVAALGLAEAALQSLKTGRTVTLAESAQL